jgi:hypothetical protein
MRRHDANRVGAFIRLAVDLWLQTAIVPSPAAIATGVPDRAAAVPRENGIRGLTFP